MPTMTVMLRRSPFRCALVLASMLLLASAPAGSSLAQQADTSSVLPDIAPREVEIRGQLEISLPSLRRQPLVGFNPPPRIPPISVERRPWVGDYKQESADLPGSPLQSPEPPPTLTGANFPPARGMVAAWGGRYYSRSVRARLNGSLSEASQGYARITYDGLDGHTPDGAPPELQTPSDVFDGEIGFHRYGQRLSVGLTGEGFYESYTLFAAQPDPRFPRVITEPVRKGGGGTGQLSVRTLGTGPVEVDAAAWYGNARYQTRRFDDPDLDGALLTRAQQHLGLEGSLTVPRTTPDLWLEADVQQIGLADDLDAARGGSIAAGVALRQQQYHLRLGARYLGAWSDVADLRSDAQRIDRVAPDVRLDVYPTQGVRVYAQNRPHVETPTLADVYAEIPYLVSQPEMRPSVTWLNAEGGVQVYAGPVQIVGRGGYRDVRQYRYVQAPSPTRLPGPDGYRTGLFQLQYADARITHVGADLSVVLPGMVHATLSGTYRNGTFSSLDGAIPYFADVVGEATVSFSFAQSRGLLQVTGRYERLRPIDRFETGTAPPFVDLDTHLSFDVSDHIGLLAHVDNVGFGYNEYWRSYPQSPSVIGAGVRVRW